MAYKVKPPKITTWIEVSSGNDLAKALADVTSPGFGNVGKHIGYRVGKIEGMKNWPARDKRNLYWLLNNPQRRIRTDYTYEDFTGGNL